MAIQGKLWCVFAAKKGEDGQLKGGNTELIFKNNGSFRWGASEGTYEMKGNTLLLRKKTAPGNVYQYYFKESDGVFLTLIEKSSIEPTAYYSYFKLPNNI